MSFRDGLGERRLLSEPNGPGAEVLALRRELATVPSFEFALRERVTRLAAFRHTYYSRVRSVERSTDAAHTLTVTSDATPGIRLSELLADSHARGLAVPIDVAVYLIRQLVPAVSILHETARDAAHGAIAPERLILGPNNRLVVVEYVLGSALEQLLFSRERYWTELRIALPRVAGLPRFDHLADVTQIGVVALQLILGRLLRDDEYPGRAAEIVSTATAVSPKLGAEPLAPGFKGWLNRALQLDPRHSFPSAIEARSELDRVISESGYDASPDALDAFLTRYNAPDRPAVAVVSPGVADARATPRPMPVPVQTVSPTPTAPLQVAPPIITPAVASSLGAKPIVHAPAPVLAPAPPAEVAEPLVIQAFAASLSDTSRGEYSPGPMLIPPPEPESDQAMAHIAASRRSRGRFVTWAAAAMTVIVIVAGGALVGAPRFLADEPAPATAGTLTIATSPDGAEAIVDGVRRGTTPVTISLSAGPHKVELRGSGEPRVLPITMIAGGHLSHYVEMPRPVLPAPVAEVASTPAPAPAPPVVAPAAPQETLAMAGWIAVQVKGRAGSETFDVDVLESGRLLGNSRVDRIMVPAGRHDLELVNAAVGLRAARTVQVAPGKVSSVTLDPPNGTLSMNALPWAEVWLDGDKIGETPIGNLSITVGSHELVFRHPELGEHRQNVVVTMVNPVRVSVDLRKP